MSPVHANKHGRRYRYYVSQGVIQGRALAPDAITRIPARELENLVQRFLQQMLGNDGMISSLLPNISHLLRAEAQRLGGVWGSLSPAVRHELTRTIIAKFCLKNAAVEIVVSLGGVEAVLARKEVVSDPAEIEFSHLIPIKLQPVQKGGTLILTDGPLAVEREAAPELVRAVAQGTMANRWLAKGECRTQQDVAQRLNIHERQVRRVLPLALVAPEIVQQVLRGAAPAGLNIRQLVDVAGQIDWATQRRALAAL